MNRIFDTEGFAERHARRGGSGAFGAAYYDFPVLEELAAASTKSRSAS